MLLDFLLFVLVLVDGYGLLGGDLFEHVLDLEDSLFVHGFIDFGQEGPVSDHSLRELNVRNSSAVEVIDDVLDEYEWLILHLIICIRFGEQHLDYGLNRWQWKRRSAQPLHQIIDRSEDQHERDLVVGIQL